MDAQAFLNSFATVAEAPDGVRRLRDLVLDLAVSGGLSSQKPAEGTGRAVVELGAAVISDAEAKGWTRRRSVPEPTAEEIPFPIPGNWAWARLPAVAHGLGQLTPNRVFTYLDVSSVNGEDGSLHGTPAVVAPDQAPSRARKAVRPGTVLYSTIRPYLRNVVFIDRDFEPAAIASTAFAVLHPVPGLDPRYLKFCLRSAYFSRFVESRQKGVAYPAINDGDLAHGLIPIPPPAEQERIVAKVDELMGLCDDLRARQESRHRTTTHFRASALHALAQAETPDDLRHAWARAAVSWATVTDRSDCLVDLRSSVLQLAVNGRLATQDPADSSAAELIERTARERNAMVTERLTRVVPDDPSYAQSGPLPPGWAWAPLQDLVRFIDYRGRTPAKTKEGVPLVTAKNIRRGFISDTPREFIAERDFDVWMTRGLPRVGDVLFTTEAPMGNAALIREDRRFALAQRTITLAPYADFMGAFLELMLLSPWFKDQLEQRATGMTATGIKASKLRLIRVPVPPVPEQARIVEVVDVLLRRCDELGASLEREVHSAAALSAGLATAMTAR